MAEPKPRFPPARWKSFSPETGKIERLRKPRGAPRTPFGQVLTTRRSRIGGRCTWTEIGTLLWHATRPLEVFGPGRAGIPWERRPSPSAGGLHPIEVVCIPATGARVALYDSRTHAFCDLRISARELITANRKSIAEVVGRAEGFTIQFIADAAKTRSGYVNSDSLIMRDAGCLLATICLCATWLDLSACALGRLGGEFVDRLGFRDGRFVAVGAVQISSAKPK